MAVDPMGSLGSNATGNDSNLSFSGGPDPLQSALQKSGIDDGQPTQPRLGVSYKVTGDSKIPVSSARGKLWKSRRDAASRMMKDMMDAWDEAIRYYNHDQSQHRDGQDPSHSNNRFVARRLNEKHSATENVVFANVAAQLPELYAKNPQITCSSTLDDDKDVAAQRHEYARAVEKLVNQLFAMETAPGINLKPKAKRAVVLALLTNTAYVEVGYTMKDKSSEQALNDLQTLGEQLANAKNQQEIEEAEQAIFALEERIEFLSPAGPYARLRVGQQVLVDPDHNDDNHADAKWVMIEDMLPTEYINAVYGDKDPETNEVKSVYNATHILDGNGQSQEDQDNFSIFNDKKDYNAYGYMDEHSFNKAKRTKVWYIWDKVTRRLEMYADNDWTWPIWVWDDPYQLQGFFPLRRLSFHINPVATFSKGEVSYYLDQQDMINEINDEMRRALLWVRRNIFYDKNKVTKEEAEKILKGPDATAVGLDVPDGADPNKLVFSIPPPSMAGAKEIFNKEGVYTAINRITGVNDVARGEQFKTNTTNRQVDYYSTMGNMRMDERLDSIEDFIAGIGWMIAQLCMRFMEAQEVSQLIGQDVTPFWKPIDNVHDFSRLTLTCVGGSSQKQGSSQKKQEAIQLGQVLSQFARAAPATTLMTTLRIFSDAFDDLEISEKDWQLLAQEAQQTISNSQGGMPGSQPQQGQPQQGQPQQGGNPAQMFSQVAEAMQQLPPQMLKAVGLMLEKGVPPMVIFQHMAQQAGAAPANGNAAQQNGAQ